MRIKTAKLICLQGKEMLKTQEKFYLADTAPRYSVLGYNSDTVAASLENTVYPELCRRGYTVYIEKTIDGEIDFVATKQNEKLYAQVTQSIGSEKTRSGSTIACSKYATIILSMYSAQMNFSTEY